MDRVRLPIRLVPRKEAQIRPLLLYPVFFLIAGFWIFLASAEEPPTFGLPPLKDPRIQALFPWFGAAFALVGLGGIAMVLLKMLPGSPLFHIDLTADGLTIRQWTRQRHFSWQSVPAFAPMQVERSVKGGIRIDHYTVAMERDEIGVPREVLRIAAADYGKGDAEAAAALAAWLNQLRDGACDRSLAANEPVEVPARLTAIAVAAVSRRAGQSTVARG
jgi:hypothetical protein